MNKYKIVTEVAADLPLGIIREKDIYVIEMKIDLDGKTYTTYPDEREISLKNFYEELEKGKHSVSSQVNPDTYIEHFSRILDDGYDILYIALSSGLSGTYNSSIIAKNELAEKYPDRKIYCVDSLCGSGGQGLLVHSCCKKRDEGKDIDTVYKWAEDNKLNIQHWFTANDLEYFRRGGRVSGAAAVLGTALNIKPVMHLNNEGKIINFTKVRGRKKSILAMADKFKENYVAGEDNTLFINDGIDKSDGDYLAGLVKEFAPDVNIIRGDIGPLIGTHTGPSILTIFFYSNKR